MSRRIQKTPFIGLFAPIFRTFRHISHHSRAILKFFNLQIIPYLTPWRQTIEERKIVRYKSWWIVLCHSILHLIALAGCLTLLRFNVQGYFIGDVAGGTLTALQFVAKLHEIIIQSSLAVVLLDCVRYFLFDGRSVPLGIALAPLNLTRITYCWSLDLWGPLTRRNSRTWLLLSLCIFAPAVIILAAVVGPSTAVLMLPRRVELKLSSSSYVFDPPGILFPSQVKPNDPEQM
jgi:hypothetical protein